MEMFETILIIMLLSIWFVFSLVCLVSAIQNFINDRKREQRETDKDKRDLEYHEARMKEYTK
jgi:Na+-transporting NADH:ubiquinone oxidoreductase subunit NqrC